MTQTAWKDFVARQSVANKTSARWPNSIITAWSRSGPDQSAQKAFAASWTGGWRTAARGTQCRSHRVSSHSLLKTGISQCLAGDFGPM